MLEQFLTHFTYVGVGGVLLVSGFGVPIPEDVPLVMAGFLSQRGYADIWLMLPLCMACVLGADFLLYLMGRRYGNMVHRLPLLRRYLTPERLARAQAKFHAHGGKTLFTARFLPGLRTPIFFTAGTFKIPFWKMLAFDGTAALISVPTLVLLGYFFPVEQVLTWSTRTQLALGAVLVLLILGILAFKFRPRTKVRARH